jgi:SSS family solute:Na+ symporter
LLSGLIFVTIPVTVYKLGGLASIKEKLPPEFFTLSNVEWPTFINWMVTIIPIWLIGMTLYQRMYACKDEKEAKKAWYIAGIFEYPIMAFTGVFLGMCARTQFPEVEAEMALPMLIKDILPIGVTGIVIASYFSAIMSTADSCLMASSGNFLNDVLEQYWLTSDKAKETVKYSMLITFLVGVSAVILAWQFTTVLDAILYAYAFMVSGLFIPTLGAYFWARGSSAGAMASMIGGGTLTLLLQFKVIAMPAAIASYKFDASLFGIGLSLLLYLVFSFAIPDPEKVEEAIEAAET